MNYVLKLFVLALVLISCASGKNNPKNKIKVIILTGSNNHNWKATTNHLKTMYAESGYFESHVTEAPDTLNYKHFKQYDVVLSNWNPFPENKKDWPNSTKQGLMKYVEEGGGLVILHAASASFYDWEAFHELIGGTWGKKTRHGKITEHKIIIEDKVHPITKGMEDFWTTDELWVNTELQENANILASSFSDSKNRGRDKMEPVMLWNTKGKGRCFYNILGHHVPAIQNEGFKNIMLRGTEWAATGKVSRFN